MTIIKQLKHLMKDYYFSDFHISGELLKEVNRISFLLSFTRESRRIALNQSRTMHFDNRLTLPNHTQNLTVNFLAQNEQLY